MSKLRTVVLKFGGSSVGSAEAFRHVAGILAANKDAGNRTVGVLSAMFGVTNRLLDAGNAAVHGDKAKVDAIRSALLDAHVKTVRELCKARSAAEATEYLHGTLQQYFDEPCREMAGARQATAYHTDVLSSLGERWSTKMMSCYMVGEMGRDAPFWEADALVVTDSVSGNASPILDATKARVRARVLPQLERGAIPLVTGFFGADASGKLTTLGRGGSDLSAAVLGHSLDAQEVSLYKVEYTTRPDGWMDSWEAGWVGVVHDADPSQTIPSLAYEEAKELAHFAKKVLHPETVSPAVEKAIPIAVRNTYDPLHPGTRITAVHSTPGHSYHTTVSPSHVSHLTHVASGPGAGRVTSITRMALTAYESKNSPLTDVDLSHLRVKREEAALVVLVGLRVMEVPGLREAVVATLQGAGIPVYVPNRVNGSSNNFSVVVPESQRNAAVKVLHKKFVEAPSLSAVLDGGQQPHCPQPGPHSPAGAPGSPAPAGAASPRATGASLTAQLKQSLAAAVKASGFGQQRLQQVAA